MMHSQCALIVDDARFMREVIRDMLHELVHQIHEACDVTEALALADLHRPDLVTLDLTLDCDAPVQGFLVLEQLLRISPQSRVVVVSALDQEWIRSDVLEKGACLYIHKPFDTIEFKNAICAILEG